ncbi:MAG: hypothetical protein WC998_09140, partial [Candidatus Paceibacterota bacterium]
MKKLLIILCILSLCIGVASAVDLKEGITASSGTEVNLTSGDVSFSANLEKLSVSTSTVINDTKFVPAQTKKDGESLVWTTGEKDWFVFDNPNVTISYDYNGTFLKETIVLKEYMELKFQLKIANDSIMIPWNEGEWKIVSTLAKDTTKGIVISKPFGVDANGNYVDINYTYSNGTLALVYDKARVYNDTLTKEINETILSIFPEDTELVKQYDYVDIKYPLIIDPTYHLDNSWSQVAAQTASQTYIYSLTQYDDGTGNAIYGGTGQNGLLLKYNKTLGAWSQVAAQTASQTYILSLTQYDDGTGNAIYGGAYPNGLLLKYNTYTIKPNTTFITNTTGGAAPLTVQFNETS